jgi:hypothetical protein
MFHQLLQSSPRQRPVDDVVRPLLFHRERPLGPNPPERSRAGQPIPLLQALDLRAPIRADDDDAVHACIHSGFEQQGDVVHDDGLRVLARDLAHQTALGPRDSGVDDRVQGGELCGMAEDEIRQGVPVQRPVRSQHRCSIAPNDVTPGGLARLDDFARQRIGVDHFGAAPLEQARNRAFPGRHSAGQSDEKHGRLY